MTDETNSSSDSLLLKAWTSHRDREAIGVLISRHINFVYAVAYRQVRGDAHLAEDVTQDLPPILIKSLELEVRPYQKHVIAKHITLNPAKPTTPEIVVENKR